MGLSVVEAALRGPGGVPGFMRACRKANKSVQEVLDTWALIARPEQLLPAGTNWDTWLILAGRGFGKTRSGAETMTEWARSGTYGRMALVAATAADARDVMVMGESGILACGARANFRPHYQPSKRRLTWPNGAIGMLYSAEIPQRLRGPQHDAAWADEVPYWGNAQECWDQLQFGLRLGKRPVAIITCTPRPTGLIRNLVRDPRVYVTKGITYDNAANLAPSFLAAVKRAYEGTRLGRQELYAEILDDNPNALWKQSDIDRLRLAKAPDTMRRIAVAIDPAVTANEDSDLTGIVVGGIGPCYALPACKGALHGFVLEDASDIYTPSAWAVKATQIYARRHADVIIGEVNNGGDLVEANLRGSGNANVRYKAVRASRGKMVRAEPISGLYEQGKIHHVGYFGKLEDEMTQWDPLAGMGSPDRMDALVWLLTELMLDPFGNAPGYQHPTTQAPRRR